MASEQLAGTVLPKITPIDDDPMLRDDLSSEPVPSEDAGEDFLIASNAYGHFHIPCSLSEMEQAVALQRAETLEPTTLQLICRKMGSGDLITGCTGLGGFLPAFHEALAPNAQIFAFEANEVSFQASRRTAALNGLDRLTLHHVIAGKQDRSIRADRVALPLSAESKKITMKRLDSIVPEGRYVSVIHLNAYDRDMPAIIGGARVIQDSMPMLVIKCPDEKRQRFYQSCLTAHYPDLDYRLAGHMDGNAIFLPLYRL